MSLMCGCDSICATPEDVDKIMYFSDCIFSKNINEGIRMYLSKLYIQLHSDKSKVSDEGLKLFNIFCQITVKIDAISAKHDVENDCDNIPHGIDTSNDECNDIFEIKCNFQIPNDVLMNKETKRELAEDDLSALSGFYQSNYAKVHITFDIFTTSVTSNFKDLILLFNSLIMNGRFDVVEIFITEFHRANEHSICKTISDNWLALVNSFIPTANTQHITYCIKFLCSTVKSCNKARICFCKFVKWAIVRSWALIRATGAGFSIVLLFIKEMIALVVSQQIIDSCEEKNCTFDYAHGKLESIAEFIKQYIYYITKAGGYIDIFEYMETQTCTIIHRVLKSGYTSCSRDPFGCKNCENGFIYEAGRCNICFDCAHTGLRTIHTLLESFLSSKGMASSFEIDSNISKYSPMWICINTQNMGSLVTFSKGFNCDAKMIFSELLCLGDDVPFMCDLILVILTYSLDCEDVYNLVLKIESIYQKLLVKRHSNWLQKVIHILELKGDISHRKCLCKEVKKVIERLSRDCDISLFLANNLDMDANLCISDIRNSTQLDGLYKFVTTIVANINYSGHENVSNFIKIFSSKMAVYSNIEYTSLITLFILSMHMDQDFKPVYTLLVFELCENSKFIADFFYYITNPGIFVFKEDVRSISGAPSESQKFTFFKYLLDNVNDCDPRNAITWTLDLKSLNEKTINYIRLQHSLLSSLTSICGWMSFEKYPHVHYLLNRITGLIEVYDLGKISGFGDTECPCKFDFPADIEGLSLEALVALITTMPYSPTIDGILCRLGIDEQCCKDVKGQMLSVSNDIEYSVMDDETPEHVSRCLEFSGVNLNNLGSTGEPSVALKLAEKMWFQCEVISEDCIWWVTGEPVDYSFICDDNQVLSELKCTIQDSFTCHTYRNLFDSVLNPKSHTKNMDCYDRKCIRFLRVWSYDPEWAFLTLVSSKDWKYVLRKLIKYKPFVENQLGALSQFFSLCEKHLSFDDIRQLKNAFDFSKILLSIDGNLTRIVSDANYRKDILNSMPLDFIQAFYSSLMNIHYPCNDTQSEDLSCGEINKFIDIIYKQNDLGVKNGMIYELSLECAQVMLDNLNLEQVSNPLVRMRLLLHPDKLIVKLVKLNRKLTRGSNFRFLWFTLRKLLAQALELYSTSVDIHGCESIPYLHFLQALLYIMPEFDLYLLHKASIASGSNRWDPVKQHLAIVANRVSVCAIKSLLEITDDSVKKLLVWLKLPSI
ncbi:hypothetical protein BMR1_01G01975 [Babesia microti strain RI]|uniref:Uncharacterized protein n=1 Tax=Babesia microti (strain RI) TaxID=1133968 RepID=I7I839_BABMR|nr:hypothetical protein BMR1_01G01975 [Babesia microti strain RI]CCF72853.1 hypothetical protein BMR1_01G01975 [Babesia microti strain RI]|eukprot:XP_012647462.1 hypothetical protein BMR1_01G01975 [Babesia microti strain RI]